MKAKFNKGLPLKEAKPITLQLLVSMSNQHQTQDGLASFVDLINQHNQKRLTIQKVEVILSAELYRYYVGDEKAKALGINWKQENEPPLKQLNVPFEIIDWKTKIEAPAFNDHLKKITQLYAEDHRFAQITDELAQQHAREAGFEAAKAYLLEECAVFLDLHGDLSYPSPRLNAAIRYVLEKFGSELTYHGYMVHSAKMKPAYQAPMIADYHHQKLLKMCLKTSLLLNNLGIYESDKQASFFKAFLQLKDSYVTPITHTEQQDVKRYNSMAMPL